MTDRSWKTTLLQGASGLFGSGGRNATEIQEEQLKELLEKIVERAVVKDLCNGKIATGGQFPFAALLRGIIVFPNRADRLLRESHAGPSASICTRLLRGSWQQSCIHMFSGRLSFMPTDDTASAIPSCMSA